MAGPIAARTDVMSVDPIERIELSLGTERKSVDVAYLRKGREPGILFEHLAGKGSVRIVNQRSGSAHTTNRYLENVERLADELASKVSAPIDAMFSPQTHRPDLSSPYREAIAARFPLARDLTKNFGAAFELRSRPPHDVAEYVRGTVYGATGDEPAFRSVLMVDDTLSTGNILAAAMIHRLRAGVPDACEFSIACAWRAT